MGGKNVLWISTSLLLFIFLMSCNSKTQATLPKPETRPLVDRGQALPVEADQWDKLVALARKEGRISVFSTANGDLRVALIKAMREKFGMEMDMVTGRGAEITVKLFNERKAGIFNTDIYIGGAASIVTDLKPAGIFEPLEPKLLLPEVLDAKLWWEGRLPFYDRNKQVFAFVASPAPPLAINTNRVSREEVKSYLDLLNPKWKGRMILNDPATPGSSQGWFQMASSKIMNLDYMKKLAQMDLTVTRDQRLQVEWLSQGKFLIAIGPQQSSVSQFQKDGAPLELLTPKEGTHVSSSSGNVAFMNKAPHPYTAKMFINWLLSKEGQTVFSEAYLLQSARLDVPTSHLATDSIRKPEVKYFSNIDEEFRSTIPEYIKLAQEIFGPLMK